MTKQDQQSCLNGFGKLYEDTKDLVNEIPVNSSEIASIQGKILDNLKMMQQLFGTLVNVYRAETKEKENENQG